jgi:hypothetical protein
MYGDITTLMGLAWSCDPESYAGGSITTGRNKSNVMIQTKRVPCSSKVGVERRVATSRCKTP